MKNDNKQLLNNDFAMALQIGVPIAFMNIVAALTSAARLTTISLFKLPFGDWIAVFCAIWVLLVLNCGPFVLPGTRGKGTKGRSRCH